MRRGEGLMATGLNDPRIKFLMAEIEKAKKEKKKNKKEVNAVQLPEDPNPKELGLVSNIK
jgi:hypothetical protein